MARTQPGAPRGQEISYAGLGLPVSADPPRGLGLDLGLASYGVAAILDDNGTRWRPKESFHALAAARGVGK